MLGLGDGVHLKILWPYIPTIEPVHTLPVTAGCCKAPSTGHTGFSASLASRVALLRYQAVMFLDCRAKETHSPASYSTCPGRAVHNAAPLNADGWRALRHHASQTPLLAPSHLHIA